MRPTGFSTGAIAKGDFRAALQLFASTSADAVELSALRLGELPALVEALPSLALDQYPGVSVHAPSHFAADEELAVLERLLEVVKRDIPVVVHPDAMHVVERWAAFGSMLTLENMDKRKPTGRTVEELRPFLDALPAAGLCLDLAHARQVDGSMTEAYRLLRTFGDRIRHVHISEVGCDSRHARMSPMAEADYREVVALIPPEVSVIIEAPTPAVELESELERVRALMGSVVVT